MHTNKRPHFEELTFIRIYNEKTIPHTETISWFLSRIRCLKVINLLRSVNPFCLFCCSLLNKGPFTAFLKMSEKQAVKIKKNNKMKRFEKIQWFPRRGSRLSKNGSGLQCRTLVTLESIRYNWQKCATGNNSLLTATYCRQVLPRSSLPFLSR